MGTPAPEAAPYEPPIAASELFNDVGARYETAFADLEPQLESIRWLLSQFSSAHVKSARILDIGCGTGRPVCSSLVEAGHDVLGIDVSSTMIEVSRTNVPHAKFKEMDFRTFEPPEESFDAVTVYFSMLASISQDDIRASIRKIYKILKPGGYFVFATVPIAANNVELRWMGRPVVVSSLSVDDASQTILENGFKILHEKESYFKPKSAEAGLCPEDEVWEEPHLFIYAAKRPMDNLQ